jgi:large repetitive protein
MVYEAEGRKMTVRASYIIDIADGYKLYIDANGKIVFKIQESSSVASLATGSTSITTGEWWHVAGTYDGSRILVWVNGVVDGSSSLSTSASMRSLHSASVKDY